MRAANPVARKTALNRRGTVGQILGWYKISVAPPISVQLCKLTPNGDLGQRVYSGYSMILSELLNCAGFAELLG